MKGGKIATARKQVSSLCAMAASLLAEKKRHGALYHMAGRSVFEGDLLLTWFGLRPLLCALFLFLSAAPTASPPPFWATVFWLLVLVVVCERGYAMYRKYCTARAGYDTAGFSRIGMLDEHDQVDEFEPFPDEPANSRL